MQDCLLRRCAWPLCCATMRRHAPPGAHSSAALLAGRYSAPIVTPALDVAAASLSAAAVARPTLKRLLAAAPPARAAVAEPRNHVDSLRPPSQTNCPPMAPAAGAPAASMPCKRAEAVEG